MTIDIAIIGGGSWGRALAYALSQKNNVGIVSRRKLSHLKSYYSHEIRQITLENALRCRFVIVAIKSEAVRKWLKAVRFHPDSRVIVAAKGIEVKTGAFMCDIFAELAPGAKVGYLMGPSFATEVMKSMPCALIIHTKTPQDFQGAAGLFPTFMKIYLSDDVIGGEVGGSYKNILAIAGGVCDGLGLGSNAKASLLARGLVEMSRFGAFFGAREATFLDLSGAGDLFLSANSILSRNYRVRFALAKGRALKNILEELGEVAEGVLTTQAVVALSKKHSIYTPIAAQIAQILEGKSVKESVNELLGTNGVSPIP